MNYIKKTVILKQVQSGFSLNGVSCASVFCAEKNSDGLKITFTPVNLAPLTDGYYVIFAVNAKKEITSFDLSDENSKSVYYASKDFNISEGFSVSVIADSLKENCKVVMTGDCEGYKLDRKEIIKLYDEQKNNKKNYQIAIEKKNNSTSGSPQRNNANYCDETLATDNYYDNDDVDFDSLTLKDKTEVKNRDERIFCDMQNENFVQNCNGQKEKKENQNKTFENEKSFEFVGKKNSLLGTFNYYNKIKNQLSKIFEEFPTEPILEKTVYGSKWAKIPYRKDEYYVVGVAFKNSVPLYVCYGIPGRFDSQPSALKGYCSFISNEIYGDTSYGYWIIYQDVDDGECVILSPK